MKIFYGISIFLNAMLISYLVIRLFYNVCGYEHVYETGIARDIRFHIVAMHSIENLCSVFLALHQLTGSDYTTKAETKLLRIKVNLRNI